MLKYDSQMFLPSAEDLPDSDDTPVDNQLQHLIPGLLEAVLAMAWPDRMDWFFGVDMGIYYDPKQPAIIPDGFLSLGVERIIDQDLRLSYLLWEEKIVPILVLEIVSKTQRREGTTKKKKYAEMGVLYYAVYSPRRRSKPRLEVFRLVDGSYVGLQGSPVWMPEIGLGIGREQGTYQGITREWLYWYDERGQRLLTPEERARQAEHQARQAEQRASQAEQQADQAGQQARQAEQEAREAQQLAHRLAEELRRRGIDPDSLL
ncbi:Uma2 family endonuclease [Kamptonema formosum]|uniref:Uma2 family endonuclease n=1 Tax=Kamptonema formosum TaxID=331992 RepID=UPI0003474734|nr:Uma2 family endonuclease [Oscillatoria sp. PCC 10802]